MKQDKLVLVCARCNGTLEMIFMGGPLRVECSACNGKVEAAERTIALLRELLDQVGGAK